MSVPHSIGSVIVVSHKWVEGAKLHPSHTQLLRGVASEATDVCSHQRHPEQAELQHRWGEKIQALTLNVCNLLSNSGNLNKRKKKMLFKKKFFLKKLFKYNNKKAALWPSVLDFSHRGRRIEAAPSHSWHLLSTLLRSVQCREKRSETRRRVSSFVSSWEHWGWYKYKIIFISSITTWWIFSWFVSRLMSNGWLWASLYSAIYNYTAWSNLCVAYASVSP